MRPLYGGSTCAVCATRGALVAHWYMYAHPLCRSSQYSMRYYGVAVFGLIYIGCKQLYPSFALYKFLNNINIVIMTVQ